MNCKESKKNFIALLEGTLSREKKALIENHIKTCPHCSDFLAEFSKLWEIFERRNTIVPDPYFWQKLKLRILEYDQKRNSVIAWMYGFLCWTRPALVIVLLVVGIFSGYLLGSLPQQDNQKAFHVEERDIILQQFVQSRYLNLLYGIPEGSLEAAYLELITEE